MLGLGVVACVAPEKNIGLESDTEGGSGSGSGKSTDDPSGEPDLGGLDVPEVCSTIGEAQACNEMTECAWVEITTIWGEGDFCAFQEPRGECILTFYQGEGCGVFPACGVDGNDTMYWASSPIGPEAVDVITSHSLCEYQPSGFALCEWDGGELVSGPDACRCACIGGGGEALPPGVEDELSERSGCSDVFLYAVNPASTIALTVEVDGGYAMQANDTEMPVDVELTAGEDAQVQLHLGSDLASAFCTDVAGVGQIDVTWNAVSGSVTLHVEPDEGRFATATATLTDVQLVAEDPGYEPYTLDSLYFENINVGWLPG